MSKLAQNIVLLLIITTFILGSCAPASIPQNTQVVDYSYEDDLTKYRPLFETEDSQNVVANRVIENEPMKVPFDITPQLNAIIDSMVVKNDSIRLIDGYTIMVYSGNDELQAGRVRNRLFDLVPEWDAQFSYKLPTYFVKVGQFYQQIEAQPLYRKIRAYYPSASIVPDKFPIKND